MAHTVGFISTRAGGDPNTVSLADYFDFMGFDADTPLTPAVLPPGTQQPAPAAPKPKTGIDAAMQWAVDNAGLLAMGAAGIFLFSLVGGRRK